MSQIDQVTIGGTWAAGDTATITVGLKAVTYEALAGGTPDDVAGGLAAALSAATEPEFRDAEWSVAGAVVTSVSTAGVPVAIAVSKVSAAGTVALANTQGATGPYHWSEPNNWGGAVPAAGDSVTIDAPVRYDLPAGLALQSLHVRGGALGLAKQSIAGYMEYRTRIAQLDCTEVAVGQADLVAIDLGTAAAKMTVTGGPRTEVELLVDSVSAELAVLSGRASVAPDPGQASWLLSAVVGTEGVLWLGDGTTIGTVQSAGTCVIACDLSTIEVEAGAASLEGSAAVATLADVRGGRLIPKSSGSINDLAVGPGDVDFSQDVRAKTVGAATLRRGGQIRDPFGVATFTSGIQLSEDVDVLAAQ